MRRTGWSICVALAVVALAGPAAAQPVDIPPTWGGSFWDRPRLTGSWFGLRDEMGKKGIDIRVKTIITQTVKTAGGLSLTLSDGATLEVDCVMYAIGRRPNSQGFGLENTKVSKDDKGFIQCNAQQQTDDPNIYAIGDVNGGTLLAHRATKEGKIAVEAILGEASAFENVVIPAVVYTDPEVAWCGLTENEAKQKGIEIKVAKFLWGASGRALTLDRPDGLTKLIIEPETERILGVGITGAGAGELIGEGVLAVEMGATARDIADSVHPHPTLSETLMEAAESFYGTATHTLSRR